MLSPVVTPPDQRFPGVTADDFDTLLVEGLQPRMAAMKAGLRPKLETIGKLLVEHLQGPLDCKLFPHVAKHQRRTVTPPADTWVAVSANPRGYKMQAHFQVGFWSTHMFIRTGVIYEAAGRDRFAANLLSNLEQLRAELPGHYTWLEDYTKPLGKRHDAMTDDDFRRLAERLATRRQADAMVGLELSRDQVLAMADAHLEEQIRETCRALVPVYLLASR